MPVRVQEQDFDVGEETRKLTSGNTSVGAVASFVGLVRSENDGDAVGGMTLEHYPGMTEKALEKIVSEAQSRWRLQDVLVIHRIGKLQPGDQIVLVIVSSGHRGEAFQACEFLMDYLKTQAPFWKKELTPEGARWVDARVSDDQALARWGIQAQNAA